MVQVEQTVQVPPPPLTDEILKPFDDMSCTRTTQTVPAVVGKMLPVVKLQLGPEVQKVARLSCMYVQDCAWQFHAQPSTSMKMKAIFFINGNNPSSY